MGRFRYLDECVGSAESGTDHSVFDRTPFLVAKCRGSPSITWSRLEKCPRWIVVSDAELVARVRRGDVEAFAALCQRYERTLLAAALAELHDVHAAEDAVQ